MDANNRAGIAGASVKGFMEVKYVSEWNVREERASGKFGIA
jgi:hypothetical protein